mgnify:CR=1 FL=1
MKLQIQYGSRRYGTSYHCSEFETTIQKSDENLFDLDFVFKHPILGRGLNYENTGLIESANIQLTENEARKIAITLLAQLDGIVPASRKLKFKREKQNEAVQA